MAQGILTDEERRSFEALVAGNPNYDTVLLGLARLGHH